MANLRNWATALVLLASCSLECQAVKAHNPGHAKNIIKKERVVHKQEETKSAIGECVFLGQGFSGDISPREALQKWLSANKPEKEFGLMPSFRDIANRLSDPKTR